jgi:ABC-type nickel/cobalt efflux system permease component RcnA
MAFGVIVIKFARETYVEISNQLFSLEAPLMDSVMLDLLLRKSMAILVIIFLVALVYKEKKIKSVKHRFFINLAAFAVITCYASLLIYLIYSPVLSAT